MPIANRVSAISPTALSVLLTAVFLSAAAVPSRAVAAEVIGGVVTEVSGKVWIWHGTTKKWRPVAAQRRLDSGAWLRTGKQGAAVISFLDGSVIRISNSADFVLESHSAKKVSLRFTLGTLEAWIKEKTRRFSVRTPAAVAAVRGTSFRVLVVKGGSSVFALFDGTLTITDNFGNSLNLAPGRLVVATKKGLQKPKPIPPSVKPAAKPKSKAKAKKKAAPKGKKAPPGEGEPGGPPPPNPNQEEGIESESFLTCVPDTVTPIGPDICTSQ